MFRKLFSLLLLFASVATAVAQIPSNLNVKQSAINNLVSLPEADTLIHANPQRIFNEAAPKVMTPADLAKMRDAFADAKKAVGVDPAAIDSLVVAVRFRKPTADLNFAPPDLLAVLSGDFSSESLLTLVRLYLQDQARDEKYGTKTLTIVKIDPIAAEAEKTPILKAYTEVAIASLGINTIAIGNVSYVKAALDAADGNNRISVASLNSLLRDPSALISAAGSPLTAFAKSFGLLGTEGTSRDPRCESALGNFYAAVTLEGNSFSLRGAMNADNPDTAKIFNGLFSSLMTQAVGSIPDKHVQSALKNLTLAVKESELVIEASIPEQVVADFIRSQAATSQTTKAAAAPVKKTPRKRRRPVKKP